MTYERLLNKSITPSEQDIIDIIGNRYDLWTKIHKFLEKNYDFNKELAFFSKKYGWTVRYRKNKKTLVSCFPEKEALSALLVLGGKEAEKVNLIRSKLNKNFLEVFDSTEQLHDGRWLWIRILNQEDLDSLLKVIQVKRKIKTVKN